MNTTLRWSLLLSAVSWPLWQAVLQDPRPLPGQKPPPPLAGVYELRKRIVDGTEDSRPSRGYLVLTARHMLLCVAAPGKRPDLPLVRAGMRQWSDGGDALKTVVKLEYYTDGDGDLHLEKPGTEERRRVERMAGGLRVVQGDRSWLEFERIE